LRKRFKRPYCYNTDKPDEFASLHEPLKQSRHHGNLGRSTSGMGQKRKNRHERLVSAFDLIADEQADIRAGQLSANRVGLAVLARVK